VPQPQHDDKEPQDSNGKNKQEQALGVVGRESPLLTQCDSVKSTWNVENGSGAVLRSPERLLSALIATLQYREDGEGGGGDGRRRKGSEKERMPKDGIVAEGRWYTSCVVQHNELATEQVRHQVWCGVMGERCGVWDSCSCSPLV
jgi:hypothetical protein